MIFLNTISLKLGSFLQILLPISYFSKLITDWYYPGYTGLVDSTKVLPSPARRQIQIRQVHDKDHSINYSKKSIIAVYI
jgi:hypothetical protein